MDVGSLFINLGVKGTDKTVGALTGVKKGLGEAKSMALETKVAIVAAIYALERLFSTSSQKGQSLENLSTLLGVSTKTLQQYEYAARQVGISNEAMDATFVGLQKSMTDVYTGKGLPEGLSQIQNLVGGFSQADIEAYMKNPEKLLLKLQEYAQKEQNVGLRNRNLRSFVSDDIIAGFNRNAFTPEKLKAAPLYSAGETRQLAQNEAAIANIKKDIEMWAGHFNAKNGKELIENIGGIVKEVFKLVDAFGELAKKLELMKWFGKAIEGWAIILRGISGTVGKVGESLDKGTLIEDTKKGIEETFTGAMQGAKDIVDYVGSSLTEESDSRLRGTYKEPGKPNPIAPPMPATSNTTVAPVNNTTVNQTNVFSHDGKDLPKTSKDLKKAVKEGVQASHAQAGGY